MRPTLIMMASIMSLTVANSAMSCEQESYHQTMQDTSESCQELIISFAKQDGCDAKHIEMIESKILESKMSSTLEGSATFCKLETSNGHYLIMKDDMPTLPLATIYFSLFD